jgi:hypothetical protein
MKKLRIVRIAVIGMLLAGTVALVGCSRYKTAHEGQGRGSELSGRSQGQGGRGWSSADTLQDDRATGGFGRLQENRDVLTDPLGGRGRQGGQGQSGRVANQAPVAPEQSGKSVVEIGTPGDLSGTLTYDGSEWYLDTGAETYILHFGNSAYVDSTGIPLREGEMIDIHGFVSGKEIAVATAAMDGQVYTFRSQEGRPMWAGGGRRENQVVRPYNGIPEAQPRGQGGRGRGQQGTQDLPLWYQQSPGEENPQT